MFSLFDVVRLKKEDARFGVKTSYYGAVVDIHGRGAAYTVEFVDENGETIEDALLVDYRDEDLELVIAAKDI